MLRILTILALVVSLAACNAADYDTTQTTSADDYAEYERYGQETLISATVQAEDVAAAGDEYTGEEVAIEGTISEVCQNAGCWFVFQTSDDTVIRVHVAKDENDEYEFTLPTDISGRNAVAYGVLETRELSVDEQEHYAEESESGEAAAVEYRLMARTVLVAPSA